MGLRGVTCRCGGLWRPSSLLSAFFSPQLRCRRHCAGRGSPPTDLSFLPGSTVSFASSKPEARMARRRSLCPLFSPGSSSYPGGVGSAGVAAAAYSRSGDADTPLRREEEGEVEQAREDVGGGAAEGAAEGEEGRWSRMLPELLREIIRRVETSEDRWPLRKNVVSCACVCRRWREITMGVVRSPRQSGKITFPSSLKQPGPRDLPLQCFIKRNKKNSTFYLYLSLTQTLMDNGKFLLAARRFRHGAHTEYIISLDADDLSQGSNAYVGKLSSDFWGTKFTIYDSQPPFNGAKASSSRASRRFASKRISPQVPSGNFEIGQVSYKFNLLKSRGPRRMMCTLQCPSPRENTEDSQKYCQAPSTGITSKPMILKNKAPRWHEHLQCWCLNFHGRVTVASVKNFQLVAAADPTQPGGVGDEETVLLQFGKVAEDMFTMDYRHPLSAFQAFAICLTSFGTKLACE
ncbi:hypothetical protein Taro_046571 [Colocasia esculenta]|uniref:Tubby-like F-box protein n=1 Tax=Colocasia esculenta TaxID=4460 RepID=A0A843X5R4_COLES|nr:hypothetical protein [Colocasia esculenta]